VTDVDPLPGGGIVVLARDTPVSFVTDRLLAPQTVTRSTVNIVSGGQSVFGIVSYDPTRHRVTFAPRAGSTAAGTQYEFFVRDGVSAWDGTPLGITHRYLFRTSSDSFVPPPPTAPTLSRDVAPLLAARCALSNCHGGADPVMQFDLSSAAGIQRTAVNVFAHERPANAGNASTRTDPAWGPLARIDPSSGGRAYSYLVYKLLGDGPIAGDRMPPPNLEPLTDEEIQLVGDWIARGAPDD
jgi:hypothetical protein